MGVRVGGPRGVLEVDWVRGQGWGPTVVRVVLKVMEGSWGSGWGSWVVRVRAMGGP